MTYSIVARDEKTGEFGVAVQSHYFQVGPVVPWAEAGIGAVATQSQVNVSFGPLGLDHLRAGRGAAETVKALLAGDSESDGRQVAVVDARGGVAAHTGAGCIPEAGHVTGEGFTCQANLMEKDTVWAAMAGAFTSTRGALAERMMAALEAAEAEGGDIRGKQSAAMLVVSGKPTGHSWEDRVIDLRVEDSPDPLPELRRLLRIKRAYTTLTEADRLGEAMDVAGMKKKLYEAIELAPEMVEIQFWGGLTLATSGELDEGCRLMSRAVAKDRRWIETVNRLTAVGRVPSDIAAEVGSRLTAGAVGH